MIRLKIKRKREIKTLPKVLRHSTFSHNQNELKYITVYNTDKKTLKVNPNLINF